MTAHLSVRSVKALLTRGGVDYSGLDFTRLARSATHTRGMYDARYVEKIDVRISGNPHSRKQARKVLGEHGLWLGPMPDYDDWSRGSLPVSTHP